MNAVASMKAVIRRLRKPEEALPFVQHLLNGGFQAPMLETPEQLTANLLRCFDHPQDFVLGVENNGALIGVFSFMAEPEEHYLEMLLALSQDESACGQVLAFLGQHAPGYTLDCVIHPACTAMYEAFQAAGGLWEPVQQKLRLGQPVDVTKGLVSPVSIPSGCTLLPCDVATREAYTAMHTTDGYWTAERVLAAPERFVAYVALLNGQVIGYLDVTKGLEENEVYDWQVQEAHRNRGIGTALLYEAVRCNGKNGMMMLCSKGEIAAQRAAGKVGFILVPGAESITGRMML